MATLRLEQTWVDAAETSPDRSAQKFMVDDPHQKHPSRSVMELLTNSVGSTGRSRRFLQENPRRNAFARKIVKLLGNLADSSSMGNGWEQVRHQLPQQSQHQRRPSDVRPRERGNVAARKPKTVGGFEF